jgi:hypothetical protein
MDPKKLLSNEIVSKFSGHINEQTVCKKVDQFFKHGNTFLLLELMSLRKEVKSLREELNKQKGSKKQTFRELLVR